jgi:hypothetical protein
MSMSKFYSLFCSKGPSSKLRNRRNDMFPCVESCWRRCSLDLRWLDSHDVLVRGITRHRRRSRDRAQVGVESSGFSQRVVLMMIQMTFTLFEHRLARVERNR